MIGTYSIRAGRPAGLFALLCGLLAACGSAPSGAAAKAPVRPPVPLHAAPEPAVAPTPTVAPAGRVLALPGAVPEGIAADPADGRVFVAVRGRQLVVLDAATLQLVGGWPVSGTARHLRLDGGAVLVPGEDTATLGFVDAATGVTRLIVRVGRQPHDATPIPGDRVLVSNEFGGTVSIIGQGRQLQVLPAGLQPGGVAAAGELAAAVDVRGRLLYLYRVAAGQPARPAGRLAAGVGPTHVVAIGSAAVVVADTAGNALLVDQLSPARQLERVALAGHPYGMAYDPVRQRLWVAGSGDNVLTEYAAGGDRLREVAQFPTVRQPNSVAVDSATGQVFIAGAVRSGVLQELHP